MRALEAWKAFLGPPDGTFLGWRQVLLSGAGSARQTRVNGPSSYFARAPNRSTHAQERAVELAAPSAKRKSLGRKIGKPGQQKAFGHGGATTHITFFPLPCLISGITGFRPQAPAAAAAVNCI